MEEIIVKIKGNKFSELDIDNMLIDFIGIGKSVYSRNKKNTDKLFKNFIKKYKRNGMNIISKRKHIKQFLNSAKLVYQLTDFYSSKNKYDKYVYTLNKSTNGTKAYLYLKDEKELVVIYNSISSLLENWFIFRKWGELTSERR